MFSVKFQEHLLQTPGLFEEFDTFFKRLNRFLTVAHNRDGTLISPAPAGISELGIPVGAVQLYAGATLPTGWLWCDGTAVSRSTYATLFAAIGTAFGTGDGATTFNVPDLRQRVPLGKAASGTGSTLGSTGGAIDHTHTGPSHTHTVTSGGGHTHTGPSHTHSVPSDGAHTHTGPSHTHSISADGTGATGAPSATVEVVATPAGGTFVATDTHTHTGPSHSHTGATGAEGTGATSSNGAHDHTGGTGASGTGATSSDGAHDHGGVTGSAGAGNTGTANPPFQVVNYIILYS